MKVVITGREFELTAAECWQIPVLRTKLEQLKKVKTKASSGVDRQYFPPATTISFFDQGQEQEVTIVKVDEYDEDADDLDDTDLDSKFKKASHSSDVDNIKEPHPDNKKEPHPNYIKKPHPNRRASIKSISTDPIRPKWSLKSAESNTPPPVPTYRFRRNLAAFKAVLDYAQSGELHAPSHICPRVFTRELEFWGIDPGNLEGCCYAIVAEFYTNQMLVNTFQKKVRRFFLSRLESTNPNRKFSNKMWQTMTLPNSNFAAMVIPFSQFFSFFQFGFFFHIF
jgi:hypothetical protein